MEHIYFTIHGKDSTAGLHVAIDILHWPVDRVIHSVFWATDDIPGVSPEMLDFKVRIEEEIRRRWGLKVETPPARISFERGFYSPYQSRSGKNGTIRGWPLLKGSWCARDLKQFTYVPPANEVHYIGIAADEPKRFKQLKGRKRSPLVEAGWTEAMCYDWCKREGLLAPTYEHAARDGCWFCPKQGVNQLRKLYHTRPDLWALMLKWDTDSPVTFRAGVVDKETGEKIPGKTVHDYDRRFRAEDAGAVPRDRKFRWAMLNDLN